MNSSSTLVGENREDLEKQSAEKFQKFMFDLFEKNGVIHDLRAYLRGHIVNVLKSTQSGETLSCQKHFTQRLELTFQAINILIAEYLLRLEFSYTLSVFVSEIPLANMVFSFARMLMETHDHSELRFKDADVFSILNYIGLKCDSDHANSVVEMYNDNKKTPLLLCILKCLPMYKTTCHTEPPADNQQESSTEESTTSKSSIEKCHHKPRYEKCKHYSHCKTCRSRVARIKEKYKRKERGLAQSLRQSSVNSLNVESFMKNISVMEKGLIDELFQQLKSVYEAEIEMMKQEEDKRVKRSLVAHAVQLQKKSEQLESSFKAREAALAAALQQKKRVLWSVAQMLKQQHQQMARAMNDVNAEARDLALKEESLKTQLAEAETILRQRGEDMRKQISTELTILSNHLESMKLERDNINRERAQLENLKLDSSTKPHSDQEQLRSHYDLLKDELSILKKYVETVKLDSKCVIERSTMTELSGFSDLLDKDVVLNNRKEASEDEGPKRLVNDLKKQKNVNFEKLTSAGQSEPNRLVYEYQPRSRSRSRSSSEAGDAPDDAELVLLQDENRRLKEFARQQKEHIDSLAWQHARLQVQISSQSSTLPHPIQPTILPHTSAYTPQASNVAPQTANFTPLPASYATISANFPPRSTNLNAQSATVAPQSNFTSQSANFGPQTFHFAARSAFFAPQSSNMSRQTGAFAPQSGTFGTTTNAIQRPRTASPTGRRPAIGHRLQPSTSVANLNVGWRVGAGEELSVFTSVPARVVLPGDDVPFIGVVGNRHTDNRRYLINQWRSLRRRLSPVAGVSKRSASSSRDRPLKPCIAGPTMLSQQDEQALSNLQPSCSKNDTSRLERNYLQPKSTAEKCVKAERKSSEEKLKDEGTKIPTPMIVEKSPNSVLREAKLRLRKLEIEAEAVEKSYLDFRRKKEAREEREKREGRENDIEEAKRSSSLKKLNETYTKETQRVPLSTLAIDKLLNEINTKLDLPSFKNKNSTEFKINPIPKVYSDTQDMTKVYSEKQDMAKVYRNKQDIVNVYSEESKKENYLETPLNEFRRLYHSERRLKKMERQRSPASKSDSNRSSKRDTIREFQNDKEKELEIFKHNLGKIYNMSENSIVNYPSELSVNEVIEIENDIHENVSDIVENQNEPDNVSYIIENGAETNENIIQEDLSESKQIENINENSKEHEIHTENPNKVNDIQQIKGATDDKEEVSNKNLLRVDVENVSEVNSVHDESSTRGFLLFVESAVDNAASESDTAGTKISTQMTIVVGPKRSPRKINTGEKTIERAPDLSTDILEPLYNFSDEQISSVQMQLELSKELLNPTLSELEINEDPDYPDDFSADVDNYNSPTEFREGSRISSPISLGKTTDDENFWES